MRSIAVIFVISSLLFSGCMQIPDKEENKSTAKEVKTDQPVANEVEEEPAPEVFASGERGPYDEEINEFGILVNLEDSGYPFFIATIEFPERSMKADLNLNIESLPLSIEELNKLVGQYITFYYIIDEDNTIYDILINGSSILGEYALDMPDKLEITGILSGAEHITAGDLPDEFTVTDENGYAVNFIDFITSELSAANGKEITIYYGERSSELITYILASE